MAQTVQFLGCYPGFDVGGDEIEHFRAQTAGNAHFFDFFGSLDANWHGTKGLANSYFPLKRRA
jgi:hypothetical protein